MYYDEKNLENRLKQIVHESLIKVLNGEKGKKKIGKSAVNQKSDKK